MKSHSFISYWLRTVAIICATIVHGTAFLLHRLVSGNPNVTYPHTRAWCRRVLALAGVKIIVEGKENISPEATYIFIANHASQFDIPVLVAGLPCNVRIMYKRELQKIPFMGWALKYSTYIPIIREKARDAMSTVERTVQAITADSTSSLIIFAEGTRTHDGSLQPFKRGAFVLATKSGKPVLPVGINGSYQILPRDTLRFRPGTIVVRIGKEIPIPHKDFSREEEKELMQKVHNDVAALLQ